MDEPHETVSVIKIICEEDVLVLGRGNWRVRRERRAGGGKSSRGLPAFLID